MPDTVAAGPSERLPWLDSTPARAPTKAMRRAAPAQLLLAALGGAALVAAGWGWSEWQASGEREASQPERIAEVSHPRTEPAAQQAPQPPSPSERAALQPEPATASPASPERMAEPRPRKERAERRAESSRRASADSRPAADPAAQHATAASSPPKLWPSRQVAGASGRLVQIGAFGTREQARRGWRRMERSYPAVGRLPAVIVDARNSKGRRYYRLQIGTTSHAHSEVLCQRMESINFSCAVLGLPWKAKIER